MSNITGATTFKMTNTKSYVPIVKSAKMKGSEDLFIGMNIKQKQKQKKQMTILQDFILMLLFKELKDCMFLLLIIPLLLMVMMVLKELKETAIENISFQG